jgi:hypothetical protein
MTTVHMQVLQGLQEAQLLRCQSSAVLGLHLDSCTSANGNCCCCCCAHLGCPEALV